VRKEGKKGRREAKKVCERGRTRRRSSRSSRRRRKLGQEQELEVD